MIFKKEKIGNHHYTVERKGSYAENIAAAIEAGKPFPGNAIEGKTETQILRLFQNVYNTAQFSDAPKPGEEDELIGIRHATAKYTRLSNYADNRPLEKVPFFAEEAVENFSDLDTKGVALVENEAPKLFSKLDPSTDVLYFATSPSDRAVETARRYKDIAQKAGFQIIDQEKKDIAHFGAEGEKIGARKFESMRSLEMVVPASLSDIFCGRSQYPKALKNEDGSVSIDKIFAMKAWSEMPEELRARWRMAKEIVLADDSNSWSENYFRFAERVREIFPEIPDPVEASRRRLEHYRELFERVKTAFHADPANARKNLKFVYFTHDETFASLGRAFGPDGHRVANCEPIRFRPNADATSTVVKGGMIAVLRS